MALIEAATQNGQMFTKRHPDGRTFSSADDIELASMRAYVYLSAVASEAALKALYMMDYPNPLKHPRQYNHNLHALYSGLKKGTKAELARFYDGSYKRHAEILLKREEEDIAPKSSVKLADLSQYWEWCGTAIKDFKYKPYLKGKAVPIGLIWEADVLSGKEKGFLDPGGLVNYATVLTSYARARGQDSRIEFRSRLEKRPGVSR